MLAACVSSNSTEDNGYPSLPLLPLSEFSAERGGRLPLETAAIDAASDRDIGFRLEPALAPIDLEPDGSAPIYRKDTASTMTLAFNNASYVVALTVTDTCGSASDPVP